MVFPPLARAHLVTAKIIVNVQVDTEGQPVGMVIAKREVSASNVVGADGQVHEMTYAFDNATFNFIKGCRWAPAIKDGKPVRVTVAVPLAFQYP